MAFDGANITYLTPSFFPLVNYDPYGTLGISSQEPSVAMTTRQIFISAKGLLNSTNNPAAGPDTSDNTDVFTVISHPAAVSPQPTITFTHVGNNGIIAWPVDAGMFTLQKTDLLKPIAWGDVTPQPAVTTVGSNYQMTVPVNSGTRYLRLAR
jgi:hypothetical protein